MNFGLNARSIDGQRSPRASRVARALRSAVVALAPTLIGFACEKVLFAAVGSRWLLMVAAVIVSAANGGMAAGLVATVTSTALVWWFLIPPTQTLGATDPRYYLSLATFVAIGYAVSLLHERLRRASALLGRAARENQIFAALIENSLDFIGIADPDGSPVYLNPAGRRMVELPDGIEIEHTQIGEYYPPELRQFAEQVIVAGMRAHGEWAGETSFRNWRTGASIPVLDTHFLIRDRATGEVIGLATITRDISGVKAQRDELEKTNRRLSAALDALAESQRFLQGILDYSPNAIVIKSLDGRYLLANQGFGTVTGAAVEGIRRKRDSDLFPPTVALRLRANDAATLAKREAVVTEESLERAGERRVYLVTNFPLLDDAKNIFALCAIWTDITQRKRDEEALRQAASDLRSAQRVAHVGSWRWDVRTGEIQWSEELYRIFGLSPDQPRRVPLFMDPECRILSDESASRARAAVEKTLADGTPYELELDFRRPDGSMGYVEARGEALRDETGRVIGINGTSADITKIKELQRLRDEWTSVIAHDLRQPIGTILMASDILSDIHERALGDKEQALIDRVHGAAKSLRRLVDDLLDMSLLEAKRLKLERTWKRPHELVKETIDGLAHLPGIERVKRRTAAGLPPISVDAMRMEQVLANLVSNAIKYGDEHSDITIAEEQRGNEVEITVSNRGPGIAPDELPQLFNRFMRSRSTRGAGVPGLGLGLYIAKGIVEAHGGRLWAESTPGETTTFHVVLPMSASMREAA